MNLKQLEVSEICRLSFGLDNCIQNTSWKLLYLTAELQSN